MPEVNRLIGKHLLVRIRGLQKFCLLALCRYGGRLRVLAFRLTYDAKSQHGHIGRDKGASKRRNWSY